MKFAALCFALLLGSPLGHAQTLASAPFIAVHGDASRDVVPDTFPLTITLEDTSKDVARTQSVIEALAQSIIELAKTQNVADADLTVGNLSIDAATEFDEKKEETVFVGNTYSREIRIRFHALEDMQRFLRVVPAGKQIQLGTGEYTYSKSAETRRELMASAIDEARKAADEIAAKIGKRIIGVHTVSDVPLSGRYLEGNSSNAIEISSASLLAPGTVRLTLGVVTLQEDAYVVYLIGD
jgi:hypothetical protein